MVAHPDLGSTKLAARRRIVKKLLNYQRRGPMTLSVAESGGDFFDDLFHILRRNPVPRNRDDRIVCEAAANDRGSVGQRAEFVREGDGSEHENRGDAHNGCILTV